MTSFYFLCFCLGIAYIIFWCFKNDDQEDFQGQKRDEKYTIADADQDDEKQE